MAEIRAEILEKTGAFLRTELRRAERFAGMIPRMADYRIEHSFRVANIGAAIARAEGLDVERTAVACLLHDVGYSVEFRTPEEYRNHGRIGARIARPFLLELGYAPDDAEEMCYGIAIHVDDVSDFEGERTPLVLTVGDADNVDRFDAFRIYDALHDCDYRNLPPAEQRLWVEKRISRLNQLREMPCGTPTGQRLWQEKTDYQLGFFQKLLAQIRNSETVF